MDEDTLEQLLDGVRKCVNERRIPLEEQVAEEDSIPPKSSKKCARWDYLG